MKYKVGDLIRWVGHPGETNENCWGIAIEVDDSYVTVYWPDPNDHFEHYYVHLDDQIEKVR
tara:strand:+ start:9373 stop:9555 length:183 start_codon:yes stop_codon:yes gene_type:complete